MQISFQREPLIVGQRGVGRDARRSLYAPTQGGTFREIPEFLALKKAEVNVNNTDNQCVGYSLLASRVRRRGTRNRTADYDHHFGANTMQ